MTELKKIGAKWIVIVPIGTKDDVPGGRLINIV